ncbi:MAG: 2-oxoisovalerate dehydrogenase subunit alpha [Chloroflexota bacterium]|nr:thiamine pyrophosphate-dependent dehydrogenase E1 component subunit alpha [Chloroflexota bacterium]NOG63191.1 thiamine pyrophosphate-dependent dehydrogenase E1 component subunit alpha [Chloroflexota bacterium]GIK64449.1 MAG: 2-oxoisovalerate dehydrogenase subunit alpha [Chloroflexota bacterium]
MTNHAPAEITAFVTASGSRPSDSLSDDTLRDMYWMMLLSRRLDERAWILHRQGRIAFHISGMGHEACQVGAGFAINRGVDYVHPYYRDLALVLTVGFPPEGFMLSLLGKAGEPSSGARQMPSHFSAKWLNILSHSSPVATQVPQAAGLAFAIQYKISHGLQDPHDDTQPRLALTCLGEGSTSQGEWHEGMNWAGVHKLPFICLVQNNIYAISVPVERQMAVNDVADRAAAYGVEGLVVDGNDILACYDVMSYARDKAYAGDGATLIEAKTYRPVPHSSDDDDRSYRTRDEVEQWKKKDPISRFQKVLLDRGVLTQNAINDLEAKAKSVVDSAQHAAEDAPYPDVEPNLDPRSVYAPGDFA